MLTQLQLSTLAYVVFGLWSAIALYNGVAVKLEWFGFISTAVAGLFVLLVLFDKWVWRWGIFRGWLVKRPRIWGTWRATLRSTYRDPATGEPIAPITAFMLIRQTYSRITLRLMTPESCSDVIAVDLRDGDTGCFSLASVYQNTPRLGVRDRSPIHFGALLLQIPQNEETVLTGHFWTDRDTRGEIELADRRKGYHYTYQAATAAFNAPVKA